MPFVGVMPGAGPGLPLQLPTCFSNLNQPLKLSSDVDWRGSPHSETSSLDLQIVEYYGLTVDGLTPIL
jgi:hypothetical protein